jgi:hypothetical protein
LIFTGIPERGGAKDIVSFSAFVSWKHRSMLMKANRYRRPEDARMALEQMDGFELAGRTVSVSMSVYRRLNLS